MFDTTAIDQRIQKLASNRENDSTVVVHKLEPSTVRRSNADVRVTHAKFAYTSPDNTNRDDVQRCVYNTFGPTACADPHTIKISQHAITADILAPEYLTMPRRNYAYWSGTTAMSRDTPTLLWAQPGDRVRAFHGMGLLEGEVMTLENGNVIINGNGDIVTLPLSQVARITKAHVQASFADPAFHCMAKYFPEVFRNKK